MKKIIIAGITALTLIGMSGCGTYTPETAAEEICKSFQNMDLESIQEHGNSYFLGLAENKQKSRLKLVQKYYSDCSGIKVEPADGGDFYNYKFKSKSMQKFKFQKFNLDTKNNTYTIIF